MVTHENLAPIHQNMPSSEAVTAFALRVHRGTRREQQLHHLDVAVPCCVQQRCSASAEMDSPGERACGGLGKEYTLWL